MCKPNGSLAYPSLAGALRRHGTDVGLFDACVGNDTDDLDEVFYNSPVQLPSGLLRTGVSDERILAEVAGYDIIGITSIFTEQETMVLRTARLIRDHFPGKILISGGVNARSRLPRFFAAGFAAVCLSESEETITRIVDAACRSRTPDFSAISGVATMHARATAGSGSMLSAPNRYSGTSIHCRYPLGTCFPMSATGRSADHTAAPSIRK